MAIRHFAPAKLNLALHVTGRRADGLHLLDSLVCFAGIGDFLTVEASVADSLTVTGPFAKDVPTGVDNLIWKAADLMPDRPRLQVVLDKTLPAASGIGGGTADAAAMIRAIHDLTGAALPETRALLAVGADLPVCLGNQPCIMRGVGEDIEALDKLPIFHGVLVNPLRPVSTGAVFAGLAQRDEGRLGDLPRASDPQSWITWLKGQRNDLSIPAQQVEPAVARVLTALNDAPGIQLARMSGSGGTCFGLFESRNAAASARDALRTVHPDWWVRQTGLNVS